MVHSDQLEWPSSASIVGYGMTGAIGGRSISKQHVMDQTRVEKFSSGTLQEEPGSKIPGPTSRPCHNKPTSVGTQAPAGLIPAQAPIVSLQELGGTKAATASATALQPIESLLSQAGGLLPSLFSGLGRKMLRAE